MVQKDVSKKPYRVLVVGEDGAATRKRLLAELDSQEFRIVLAPSIQRFLQFARRFRPDAAVLDLALGRGVVGLLIAVLKENAPSVRIIAVSETPSLDDGPIVEQGLFYYLTGPIGSDLVELLRAAARRRV